LLRRPALAQDGREFTRTTQQRRMWTSNMREGIEDGASVEWMRGPDVGGPNKPFFDRWRDFGCVEAAWGRRRRRVVEWDAWEMRLNRRWSRRIVTVVVLRFKCV
jgi:hypothetical protein